MVAGIEISKRARKQLRKLPGRIVRNLRLWVHAVTTLGLEEVRKIPGYHDEPLKGVRSGQRSIRLSRSCRVIYEIAQDEQDGFVLILEVSKHGY
jgi:proteic killer suppression protein